MHPFCSCFLFLFCHARLYRLQGKLRKRRLLLLSKVRYINGRSNIYIYIYRKSACIYAHTTSNAVSSFLSHTLFSYFSLQIRMLAGGGVGASLIQGQVFQLYFQRISLTSSSLFLPVHGFLKHINSNSSSFSLLFSFSVSSTPYRTSSVSSVREMRLHSASLVGESLFS